MLPLEYFLFLQIILFLFITPGTPRIVIISYSINYGVQKCIWTALGDISANIIQATLVIFVIGSFISDHPLFLNIFKWVGIIYLIYLAFDIYKSRPKDIKSTQISEKNFFSFFKDGFVVAGTSPKNINSSNYSEKSIFSFFKDGFLVAGTSPKAWMFFPFIFPQFIDFNSNYVVQFFILITTYIVLDFLSLIGYAILANKLVVWLKANPKVINTISACVLIVIAIIIAVTQQY